MTQASRDHQLTIRIPQRIRDAIDVQAERERRSVADVINNLLEQHYPAKDPTKDQKQGRRR